MTGGSGDAPGFRGIRNFVDLDKHLPPAHPKYKREVRWAIWH